jgi:hypothetical protein
MDGAGGGARCELRLLLGRTLTLAAGPWLRGPPPRRSPTRATLPTATQVNEWLRAYAARSGGRCEFYEPGRAVMPWAAGSSYFEVDGLHLTKSGYALLALLLLRGRTLRDFLTKHVVRAGAISPHEISLREISLPEISDAEAALRRRMRGWMEQYRVAVDAVQEQAFDVQMAKASREELEALHRVLQAEGLG